MFKIIGLFVFCFLAACGKKGVPAFPDGQVTSQVYPSEMLEG